MAPPEAEKAQERARAHLEWTRATSEQKQIEFVWRRKLDPLKQQIDTCKKDHDQKVREIQAEVAEVERRARGEFQSWPGPGIPISLNLKPKEGQ